jgi:cation transport regulator ChaC
MTVGVIAYGSLIGDPGAELEELVVERRSGLRTPFRAEYARASRGRDNAPTLVPVCVGGGHVECVLIVLRPGISVETARDVVYRREVGRVGDKTVAYKADTSKREQVWVDAIPEWGGVNVALYTRIRASIEGHTAQQLAELAVQSAKAAARERRHDGISYLIAAKAAGVITPLTSMYETEILKLTGRDSLAAAWESLGHSHERTSNA